MNQYTYGYTLAYEAASNQRGWKPYSTNSLFDEIADLGGIDGVAKEYTAEFARGLMDGLMMGTAARKLPRRSWVPNRLKLDAQSYRRRQGMRARRNRLGWRW